MAEGAKFCHNCGAQIRPGAKFCKSCGAEIKAVVQPDPAPVEVKPIKRTCPKCGNEVSDTAKFCKKCGFKFEGAASAMPSGIGKSIMASAEAGEFALMDFVPEALSGAAETVQGAREVLAPFASIGSSIKSFLGGIPGIFKSPKTIILTLVLTALWTFLGMNRDSDSIPIKALSFLTFAEGGFGRDPLGAIGGIAGKGVVGVTLASLFSGGIGKLGNGLGAVFGKTQTKRSILFMIVGLLIGAFLYMDFVGSTRSAGTAMAGISGAILSLQALGSREGCIYQMAEAFTSKKINGVRVAQDGKANSLLGGMTAGFAIITAIGAML
jgi:hypothetical protein